MNPFLKRNPDFDAVTSVDCAGIVCKLNTRCAVIAACNPKGHYQTDEPLSVNVSLGTPLLSRFDLIFILLDSKNKTWDKLVSSYILFGGSINESKKKWSLEKLQMYISLVGPRSTQMTKSANIILQSYYMTQRKSEHRDSSRTTVRMLDSLVRVGEVQPFTYVSEEIFYILSNALTKLARVHEQEWQRNLEQDRKRLSQAHCRLMYRETILPTDAIIAISLVDLSMQDCTLDDTVDALHSNFTEHPDFEYLCIAKKLLTRLNLYSIWQEELLYYGKLLKVDHKTLESDVDGKRCHIFSKYDDLNDDNIPLSSSLVTSSYFDINKHGNNEVVNNLDKNKKNNNGGVKDKLAATLKKHATLNNDEMKPPILKKRKRKRKEVTLETNSFKHRVTSKDRKWKGKDKRNNVSMSEDLLISSDSGDDDHDQGGNKTLIGAASLSKSIELEVNIENDKHDHVNVSSNENNNDKRTEENNTNVSLVCTSESKEAGIGPKSNTVVKLNNIKDGVNTPHNNKIEKLKQFQFVEKHDFNQFYEEKLRKQTLSIRTENNQNKDTLKMPLISVTCTEYKSNDQKPSTSSSQISMFESSDCELDLDI